MEKFKVGEWAILKIEANEDSPPSVIYQIQAYGNSGSMVRVDAYDKNNKFAGVHVCSPQVLQRLDQAARHCSVCHKKVLYLFTLPQNNNVKFNMYLDNLEMPIEAEYRCKKHPALLTKETAKIITASQLRKLNKVMDRYQERILNVFMDSGGALAVDIKRSKIAKDAYPYARIYYGRRGGWQGRVIAKEYDHSKKIITGKLIRSASNVNND